MEYRPEEKWPMTIDMYCGCILVKEKLKGGGCHYIVDHLCHEHDPSFFENFPEIEEEG